MTKKFTFLLIILSTFSLQIAPVAAQEIPAELENMKSEGFTITPAEPNSINPRKFIFELKPGTTARENVIVNNLSDRESVFYLYGADPTLSAQGTPAYKTRQSGEDGEGKWIKFDEPEITLDPREEKRTSFTISIPEDTELGNYRAGITMEKTKKDANNPNITIATRVILHSDIKVTDNPNPIPKETGLPAPTPPTDTTSWQVYYFWISLFLFGASFIALVWITFREKKTQRSTFKAVTTKTHTAKTTPKTRKRRTARTKPTTRKKK